MPVTLALIFALLAGVPMQAQSRTQGSKAHRPIRLPLTKFYDAPAPPPSAKPGTLIRAEQTYDYSLSTDVTTTRILYYSRAATGEVVPVSAVMIVPEKAAPRGGWPIIAWAHGFEGVARTCGPSLRENLGEGPLLSMYVNLGYAVVATDYAGLGTSVRNAYIDMQSNAADLIYSVPAARSAVRELGARWVAMGISEGDLAALAVGELETEIHDPNYLGSIALTGIIDGNNLINLQGAQGSQLPVFLAYGVETVFPKFQPGEILTDKALPLYQQAESSCSIPEASQLPANQALKPFWQQNDFVKKFIGRNTLGQEHAQGAFLVLASETDPVSPIARTTDAVARLCRQGDRVQLFQYENADPKAAIGDSVRDQIQWLQGRFGNKKAPTNCP